MAKPETKEEGAAVSEETVARGHSVAVDGRIYGPGEKVMLSETDASRLRTRGFLVGPAAEDVPRGAGPVFEQKDGPQVRRVA